MMSTVPFGSATRLGRMAKKLKFEHQIEAKHFHAGMDERNKAETQQAWQEGRVKVVVATVCFDSCVVCLLGLYSTTKIAFGMGIDKGEYYLWLACIALTNHACATANIRQVSRTYHHCVIPESERI